jgi:VWFA-related protein
MTGERMTRCLITIFAVACAVAFPGAQQSSPATFRAGTDTVSIYATVVDRNGRLVPDLTQADFQVFDNGKPQTLSIFRSEIQPITIVVMLDRSSSMSGNVDIVTAAAGKFVSALLPADKAKLGSFSHRIQIDPQDFTSDQSVLTEILRTRLLEPGGTPLWNATAAAMNALSRQDGRRVVLLFTDGYDTPGTTTGNVTFDEVVGRSQTDEVMVYSIGLGRACDGESDASEPSLRIPPINVQRGPRAPRPGRGGLPFPPRPFPFPGGGIPGPRMPPIGPGPDVPAGRRDRTPAEPVCLGIRPDPGLKVLAEESGGGYFELRRKDDLSATFSRVADELHHQYLLAFQAEKLDGTLHKLEVRLRNPNWIPRARKSYLATDGANSSR